MRAKAKFEGLDHWLSEHRLIYAPLVLLLCALIIVLRKPDTLAGAQFWAEDGSVWFQNAYNFGLWHTILLPYSGTFSVFTRLAADIGTTLPLRDVPRFFNLAGLACQLLPVLLLNSSRLKSVVRYSSVGIVASLIYVLATNSSEVFANLANSQWHLGVAAFLILIASRPKSRAWLIFDALVLAICGLTGPLTLLLIVIAFLIWFKAKDSYTLMHLGILAVTSAAQVVSLLLVDPGQRGGHQLYSATNAVKMIEGQIFTGGVLGPRHIGIFYNAPYLYVALAAGLIISFYAVKQGPSWLRYANLYSLLVFVSALASLRPLAGDDVWKSLTFIGEGQRYWYIPILVWLFTLLWLVLSAKHIAARVIAGVLLGLFIFVGVPGSWAIKPLPDKNFNHYARRFDEQKRNTVYTFPINPNPWRVILIKH